MTTVADIVGHVDAWAPFADAATWDAVGLQLGDADGAVTTAAVCHEVTDEVVDAVIEQEAEVLVTYHPLLFRPVSAITRGSGPAGIAYRLLRNGVSLVAAHTNVDAAPGGTSDALAQALGLTEVRSFGSVEGASRVKVVVYVPAEAVGDVRAAMAMAGAGTIGLYQACSFETSGSGRFTAPLGTTPAAGSVGQDNQVAELRLEMNAPAGRQSAVVAAAREAHPYEEPAIDVYQLQTRGAAIGRLGTLSQPVEIREFARRVRTALGGPPTRFTTGATMASIVAVVPGAGGDFANEAAAVGAQVLVTGDMRHHAAVAAARLGLSIVDATHEGTERPGMQALYRSVAEVVETLDLTSLETNPWREP